MEDKSLTSLDCSKHLAYLSINFLIGILMQLVLLVNVVFEEFSMSKAWYVSEH